MDWMAIIAVVGIISGIVLGWTARSNETKKLIKDETKEDTAVTATLQTDISYIKQGIDDIRKDVRVQGDRMDLLSERIAKVEESTKHAHERISELRKNPVRSN